MRPLRRFVLLAAVLAVAAASVASPPPAARSIRLNAQPVALRVAPAAAATATSTIRPSKVLVVVEENHTEGSALRGMPALATMARSHGYTTSYRAVTHPSLPNYLAMIGGSTFGINDDRAPSTHHLSGPSALDRVLAAGGTAKVYAEAMPGRCVRFSAGSYAVKHNPWAYFSDAGPRASCARFDVPAGTTQAGPLRADIAAGTLPQVGLVIPDVCHDAHSCPLATADRWLASWLAVTMRGPDYIAGRLAIVVTFDEADGAGSNTVLTVIIAPHGLHGVSTAAYTHYSLTRLLAEMSGTAPLRAASTARSLRKPFLL